MLRMGALLACITVSLSHRMAAQSIPEWRFVEELRIGSENDDPTGLSDVRGLVVDKKGNIWVLEFSAQEIRLFDPAGHHLRTIGRKGQGPGEFIYADGMAMAPDGLIWVHDPQNGRFSIFTPDGKFARQQLAVSGGYGAIWFGGIDAKGRIWDQLIGGSSDRLAARMRRASPDWTRVDTLTLPRCSPPGGSSEASYFKLPGGMIGVPYFAGPVSAPDYNGDSYWCAPSSAEYRVFKVGVERKDTLARITGRAERMPVTSAERDSAISGVKQFMKRAGEASIDWSRIPKYKPLLQGAFVDAEGRLWVRRQSPEVGAVFDLYTAQGKPVATIKVPHPVTSWLKPVLRGDVAYFVSQEPGEIPYIIRGRLVPTR